MLELVFFTSSRIKLAHAKYLCRHYAVQVVGFREKTFGATYVEPRIHDRAQLIALSYQDALQRWLKTASEEHMFFIEDTSVTIDALSAEREVPGLDVKYWMEETDFALLDSQLKALGNNRRATVRSDLVLHLPPGLSEGEGGGYKLFTSMIPGSVTEQEVAFDTNPMYPWLDNKTFNKWFVPQGCSQPISMLPIAEADKYDFRMQAFQEMLNYLESQQIIYPVTANSVQASFDFGPRLFIVCGPSCAGKTTLAEYLADQYGYNHIEASDFMYLSYYQRHGVGSPVKVGDFAEQALREKPEIVAEQVFQNISEHAPMPVIVTGFRSPSEIEWFCRHYDGKYTVEVVFITADQKVRYSRSMQRCREGEADGWDDFVERDKQQESMGLGELEKKLSGYRIENNASLEEYFERFEALYAEQLQEAVVDGIARHPVSSAKLEERILLALAEQWLTRNYFTTTEIAQFINLSLNEKPKSKNNVSRYFNQSFHPYYEIKVVDGKRKYRLSNTGYGRARILLGALSSKGR